MRQPALERVAHQIVLAGMGKALDQQLPRTRHHRQFGLQAEPVAHLIGQRRPGPAIIEQPPHPVGEIGGERELAAHIGRHPRILIMSARDIDLILGHRLVAHHFAAEHESVARHHRLDKSLFDFAEQPAAAADCAGGAAGCAARAHQPHFQHGVFDDGADIEPVALPHFGIGDPPAALLILLDARKALIALQRIAASGHERHHVVEIAAH